MPEALITTALLVLPAAPVGAWVYFLWGARRMVGERYARLLAAAGGAGGWLLVVRQLEPSHLDFIVGAHAAILGALAGTLLCRRLAPPAGPPHPLVPSPPREPRL